MNSRHLSRPFLRSRRVVIPHGAKIRRLSLWIASVVAIPLSAQAGTRLAQDNHAQLNLNEFTVTPEVSLTSQLLYVTNSNGTVVGFDSSGNRTLVASAALDNRFSQTLQGIAADTAGNLFVANSSLNNILKITSSDVVSTFAAITT